MLLARDEKGNGVIFRIIRALRTSIRDDPVWTDIIVLSCGEPIIQNLVIKRIKLRLGSLMVVIQMSSCVQDILWVATTTKTRNYNVSVIRSNREDKYHIQMKSRLLLDVVI